MGEQDVWGERLPAEWGEVKRTVVLKTNPAEYHSWLVRQLAMAQANGPVRINMGYHVRQDGNRLVVSYDLCDCMEHVIEAGDVQGTIGVTMRGLVPAVDGQMLDTLAGASLVYFGHQEDSASRMPLPTGRPSQRVGGVSMPAPEEPPEPAAGEGAPSANKAGAKRKGRKASAPEPIRRAVVLEWYKTQVSNFVLRGGFAYDEGEERVTMESFCKRKNMGTTTLKEWAKEFPEEDFADELEECRRELEQYGH